MRLCSSFLLIALLAVAGPLGCYPHQGKPVGAAPPKLLELAHDACRRHDPAAWQMLLSRLADQHPHTAEGRRARLLLETDADPMASCEPPLNPNQPSHRQNVPSVASVRLEPMIG